MMKTLMAVVMGVATLGALQVRAQTGVVSATGVVSPMMPASGTAVGPLSAEAVMMNARNETLGIVKLTQLPKGVLISLNLRQLPPGELAFHVHEKGACDGKNAFAGAGGHFNPGGREHGHGSAGGAHAGDMANLMVNENGVLRAQVLNTMISLWPGTYSVFDADGSALVIHSGADDYKSQPAGDAGGRFACGVIKAAR